MGTGGRKARIAKEPPQGSSSALRVRILNGAAEAFGRKGYADARVEDILDASKVSRPTFYKFFHNKEEVFNALAEMSFLSLIQSIKGAVGSVAEPGEKLEKAAEAFLRWIVWAGPFGRVLDTESRRRGSFAHAQRRAVLAAATAFFEDEVRKAQRVGIDPLIYVGLVAALESIGSTILNEPRAGEREIERRRRIILRILQAALAEEGDPVPPLPRLTPS